MAIVDLKNRFSSLGVTGRIGNPAGLGLIRPGWSFLGDAFVDAGIYRKNGRWKKQNTVRMRHYRPSNPQTDLQQFYRDYFRVSVAIWHALDSLIVAKYKLAGRNHHMTPYNYFISCYSFIRPADLGNYRCGFTKLGVLTYID